ncbi:hypothetical protein PIB30_069948 [Stylosanthes scabra]|uniref:F-box domain-containing protein n=1 Tax=Stylosanthes scabra TaxID=79078 RepID=A0ABU6YNR3_9FABA|nr:hypothetical protein [Stylosanthes scabra]
MKCCNPSPGKVMSKSTRPRPPRWRQSPFLRVPKELVVEIMVRVPAMCLIHLKRVCRSWRNLISSPEFVRYQVERSIAHERNYYIVGSCNGLLCLLVMGDRSAVMLWNPCTSFTSEWLQTEAFVLRFAFGYDHVNDKYKFFAASEIVSKIFTFGVNNHWKTIENSALLFNGFRSTMTEMRGEFVKGTFNWLVCGPNGDPVIVYLDLGTETYGQLSLPERDPDDDFSIIPVIDVLRNCLSVCFDHKKTHCAVWFLSKNQYWSQLAMIPHQTLTFAYAIKFKCLDTVYISDDDVLLVRDRGNRKLYLFYLKDGRILLPMIDSSSDGLEPPLYVRTGDRTSIVYYPSLLSPSLMV